MENLSEEDVKLIHLELEKKFPLMLKGIKQKGLIQAAIEKQSMALYGSEEKHKDVYTRAAVLMEAITRWHIFHDGNKRTGLLCAFLYLYMNKHYLAIPIDAVRFTQKIAATEGGESEKVEELIEEIAAWLRKFTATDAVGFAIKVFKYTLFPMVKVSIMHNFGFKKRAQKKVDYWFATDAHPEYKQESTHVHKFLFRLVGESLTKIVEAAKEHSQDTELPILDAMRCAVSEHEVLRTEEDRLYESMPDGKGIRQLHSTCFHCRKKLYLETDPEDEDTYFMFEYEENQDIE